MDVVDYGHNPCAEILLVDSAPCILWSNDHKPGIAVATSKAILSYSEAKRK